MTFHFPSVYIFEGFTLCQCDINSTFHLILFKLTNGFSFLYFFLTLNPYTQYWQRRMHKNFNALFIQIVSVLRFFQLTMIPA